MAVIRSEVRPGSYHDSIVLMQLQSGLAALPGVLDAGVVMGTQENLALLEANGLLPEALTAARPDDLIAVVKAESDEAAADALVQIDALLTRGEVGDGDEFRPRSLTSAAKILPDATWVLVSVPGRFAAGVAREALELGRNVFLYSDNVPLRQEVELKGEAQARGLLVMGPDCGTAIIGGVGFGFANRVRRGGIGLVGASGTGLQAIASRVHELGAGVSHAIGTGGRDLQAAVGGVTARQGLDLLARDLETRVVVLVSKPPELAAVGPLLAAAGELDKPVVVNLLGFPPPGRRLGTLHFAATLGEAATMAVELLASAEAARGSAASEGSPPVDSSRYLRGLFSGGTLAYQALLGLRGFLEPLHSNVAAEGVRPLADSSRSQAHTILDLGSDEFTVGRPHPMIDHDLRLRRLRLEAEDPEVGLIVLDVVLGHGAHPNPAAVLAPAVEAARRERDVEIVAVVIGTDEDPQDLPSQTEALRAAGALVCTDADEAVAHVRRRLWRGPDEPRPSVDPGALQAEVAAINVGLESFYESLITQGARAVQVEWRPPAGGDERLMDILEKLRR